MARTKIMIKRYVHIKIKEKEKVTVIYDSTLSAENLLSFHAISLYFVLY